MVKKVAVLMETGFEEGETVTIVDIIRRANIECNTFSFKNKMVKGMHDIYVEADKIFNDEIKEYDLIVLPGGRPGGENLRSNPLVISIVKYFESNNKLIAAMCSGTTVLKEADVINDKKLTGYKGYEEKLSGGIFLNDVVVYDKNLITSQGPATVYPFVFKIIEVLGFDTKELKDRLMYDFAGGKWGV